MVTEVGLDIQAEIDKVTEDEKVHGGPYDRGSADSYYRRGSNPHYYPNGTHKGTRIEKENMTNAEIQSYVRGYLENENDGNFKDWG
jgi:hypothetical protein|tara:strand:+ start:1376 stop:1633 length:258 start_codon:yes stop_codon:yes gene_type:complete